MCFFDPDNGLEVKSVLSDSRDGVKYTTHKEACDYFSMGSSVIIYNHRDRSPERKYIQKFNRFYDFPETSDARLLCLTFNKISVRDYIFLLDQKHYGKVHDVPSRMAGK